MNQGKYHTENRNWILGLMLAVVTLAAYQPAWNGKPIWDDEDHIAHPVVRSSDGLGAIWTKPGAVKQYYPLTHSIFWLELRLWGGSTLGYHLLGILLHIISALLLVRILRYLKIPGEAAWLAGAIFALHPVQVESVAWMTELKNTLSGVFFLSAALSYLKFDSERKKIFYASAIGFFVLGLFSKSVIAPLPLVLCMVFWWQRGRIAWKHDVVPLLPFFVLGIASGLFTAWVERRFIGASGDEFNLPFIERCLIAGRAVLFYLGKLCWPFDLIFIYPRWNVSAAVWWQYIFPASALLFCVLLWTVRNRWRAPLAVFCYFVVMLFPVLGFLNVYPFRYSFVADHFQYCACIGPIVLAAVGMRRGFNALKGPMVKPVLYGIFLTALGVLTWQQCGMYADAGTLYRTVVKKNPACWMAHLNLGYTLREAGRISEAIEQYRKVLTINPDLVEAWYNLGNAAWQTGQNNEAIASYRRALQINPDYADVHYNLGNALFQTGRPGEAIAHYRKALELKPGDIAILNNLSVAYQETGRPVEAICILEEACSAAKALGKESLAAEISAEIANLRQTK